MILGLSIPAFTLLHVALSLVGILSGFVVVAALLEGRQIDGWTMLFLATTLATSVTGFFFPTGLDPARVVGVVSVVALAIALFALYGQRLAGSWRWIYVVSAVLALYLNVFVAVVQAFQKIPFLHPLAPTQSEPPFLLAQIVVLIGFASLGFLAVRRFQPLAHA